MSTAIGLGLIFATSTSIATQGVITADTGVASALVSTSQQVGGSIGVAVLNTLGTTAGERYFHSHAPTALTLAQATVHGYTTVFWAAAAIFALGAVVTAALLGPGVPAHLTGTTADTPRATVTAHRHRHPNPRPRPTPAGAGLDVE